MGTTTHGLDYKRRSTLHHLIGLTICSDQEYFSLTFLKSSKPFSQLFLISFFSNKKIIVSPAFLRAYELETKQAIYPRVIIDPTTLAHYEIRPDWGGSAHPHKDDKNYVYGLLIKDPIDNLYFIDYLNFAYRNADESGPEYLQFLLGIQRKLILTGLHSQCDKIRKKYQWLGWYQNLVISQYPDNWELEFKQGWKDLYRVDERLL